MKAKNTIIFLFGFFFIFSSYPAWSLQFDVTRTDDPTPDGCNSGVDCSLREAVIAANANGGTDTINLQDETYQLTIPEAGSAASGDLDYDGSGGPLTIQGAGENLTVIEADPALASRLIQTANDADLTISNLTLRKGKDDIGGAILVPTGDTNLTLIDCTFTENESTGGGGGALFFSSTGTLTLQNGSFLKNVADADGGGAIFMTGGDNTAQHQMEGTSFTENQVLGGQGGALFVGGNYDQVTLSGVQVSENSALDSNGGGIAASFGGNMILENCRVQGNESQFAGGVYFTGSGTNTLTVTGSEILENKAASGAGGMFCSGSEIVCAIEESLFRRNEAAGGPGGGMQLGTGGSGSLQHSIIKSIFEANRSVGDGGGLYFTAAKGLKLTESRFLGNTANDGRGGGVFASSGGQAVNVEKCVVQDNQSDLNGGGLYISLGGLTTITDSFFDNNQTRTNGSQGGGLHVDNGGDITVDRSTFSANHADGDGGGARLSGPTNTKITNSTFSGNTAQISGGAVWLSRGGQASLNNVTMVQNTATSGIGGGVNNQGNTITFRNSLFFQNSAASGATDDCAGNLVVSDGYNLFGPALDSADCGLDPVNNPNPNDQYGGNPMIGLLADNGGLTPTHELLPDSPAINGGNPAGCEDADGAQLTVDQRSATRPFGGRCDIGAFESHSTFCGDGICDVNEDCGCADCQNIPSCLPGGGGECGDGICAVTEDCSCEDCDGDDSCQPGGGGDCGDGICAVNEDCTCADCSSDPTCQAGGGGSCGDGICAVGETCACADCDSVPSCQSGGGNGNGGGGGGCALDPAATRSSLLGLALIFSNLAVLLIRRRKAG